MKMRIVSALVAAACLVLGPGVTVPAGAKSGANSSVRDRMSDEQKKKLRKMGYDYCRKKHGSVQRVEILSTGKLVCYYFD
jgi:hypothetical protein